jgi:serine/threonine-protein phosphatase 6 regulatory ankyrin repeat subunit B
MKPIFFAWVVSGFAISSGAFAMAPHAPQPAPAPTATPSPIPLTQNQLDQNLLSAIIIGDEAGVRSWLAQGANPNDVVSISYGDSTPFAHAAHHGNIAILADLLQAGANINQTTGNGHLPLDEAEFHPDAVAFLLSKGADPNISALFYKAMGDSMPPLVGFAVNDSCDPATTPVDLTQNIDALLAKNADPNGKDSLGQSALFAIECRGRSTTVATFESVATKLLKAGADINARDLYGKTPLISLYENAENHGPDFIAESNFLIQQGADPTVAENDGTTLLMRAAELSDDDGLAYYLGLHKIDLNATDKRGQTALIRAAIAGDQAAAIALINAGACLDMIDNDGKTALGEAIDSNQTDIANLLRTYTAQPQR